MGDDILHSFTDFSTEDKKKYAMVKVRFDKHFMKKRNIYFEHAKFNTRKRVDGEPVDTFITALHLLADHCNYGVLHDEMIEDWIVMGICNTQLAEKLQLDPDLTCGTVRNHQTSTAIVERWKLWET